MEAEHKFIAQTALAELRAENREIAFAEVLNVLDEMLTECEDKIYVTNKFRDNVLARLHAEIKMKMKQAQAAETDKADARWVPRVYARIVSAAQAECDAYDNAEYNAHDNAVLIGEIIRRIRSTP